MLERPPLTPRSLTPRSSRRAPGGGLPGPVILVFAAAFVLLVPAPAWAIPSPDLVLNLFASAAQVLGLLTVVLGGFAYSCRRRPALQATRIGTGVRWAFRGSLVLLLLSLAGNVLQFSSQRDETSRRLRANLTRPSKEDGKKVGDASLKELSFSEQIRHPLGIQTEDLSRWLEEGRPLNMIDVRETEEVEVGRIAGSWHSRYPDLQEDTTNLIVPGKETLLLCYSGNRSSELCNEFRERGYHCRFMIGGYEKWIAEGRSLELADGGSPRELREIPEYPNRDVLLDTPEVMRLFTEEDAFFVDVRYPGEFEQGHLPGAVNLTLRKLTSDALLKELQALDRRPIVAPCYDKRSSFYAAILGLRLHRLGYDFRGRYTVPHEFVLSKAEREHVAAWSAAQEKKTLLGMAAAPLKASLEKLTASIGSLALAILALVLALRLLLLPLTVKAERDQVRQQALVPRLKALKEKLAADPQRFSRAVRGLQRDARLTPVRNLLAAVVQITLFLIFFSVVSEAAAGSTEPFLWIPALGDPDPLHALPLLVGALVLAHLRLSASRRTRTVLLLHVLAGALLYALTFRLSAAVNLYLAFNVALLLAQSQGTRWRLARREHPSRDGARRRRTRDRGVVLLKDAHRFAGTGNKAARLGRMIEAGLPVPPGFCVTDTVLCRPDIKFTAREQRTIARAWKALETDKVAVRSSGLNEDGAGQSYAGIFESVLNVRRADLLGALEAVRASLNSERAEAYGGNGREHGGVLVQRMVAAEYAGVLFTEHPTTTGASLVELVAGLGDSLVSGSATPEEYRFGRLSGVRMDSREPPIDLRPLLALGRKVEALFGAPQDIEWAYARGSFQLLQARDITTSARSSSGPGGALERERHRLLEAAGDWDPRAPIFVQNELSELLPRPTPLSLSFMERLWAPGGSTDLACRSLGIPYDVEEEAPPLVNSVFGALYINRREERRRLGRGPGAVASFKLARSADGIQRGFQETFLTGFLKEMRLREALDLSRLGFNDLHALYERWLEHFVTETYVEAEIINVAADFYMKAAARQLQRKGLDPAVHLSQLPRTIVHRAMSLLPAIQEGERSVHDFLELFGHRAPHDYELAEPRYREDSSLVVELVARACAGAYSSAEEETDDSGLNGHRVLKLAVSRAREFQALKEEAKHHALRELATLRSLLLEIDERLELSGGIFYLTVSEVGRLREEKFLDQALDLIDRRRTDLEEWKGLALASELSIEALERFGLDGLVGAVAAREKTAALQGKRVSGEKEVVGRVRVVRHPEEIRSFREGEILVTRFTDPTWTPLFPRIAGVITEVGGWLSHAAIVAREYRVTAIVGVTGAMEVLETGDLVRMRADGTVEQVRTDIERRRHHRVRMSARVALLRQGQIIEAILRNLSQSGALVESEGTLEEGQGVRIRISSDTEEVSAEVVRRDASGGYALRFTTPIADPAGGPAKN
jgi:YidC/Oxa1 family membrane protein insertase